ncbi:MAG: oxidoreductase, partial [Actinomycetota bacterium]|nr:oxidoreductase [Actinomycetota bacterium]
CDIAPIEDPDSPYARFVGVKPYAVDADNAARLWNLSVELTGVNAFG